MNKRFQAAYMPDRNIDIDESLTLWKGKLGFLYLYYTYNKPTFQYLAIKTTNLGIKTYERCGSSNGYLRKFIIYRGSETDGHWNVNCLDNLKSWKIDIKTIEPLFGHFLHGFFDGYFLDG